MVSILREYWQAQPFVPFTIHLADGRKFELDVKPPAEEKKPEEKAPAKAAGYLADRDIETEDVSGWMRRSDLWGVYPEEKVP